nr:transcriptional regulator FilR1 domain-containing protein [Methanosalsum zhilinae]
MTEDYNKIFTNLINTNKFNFYLHPENLGFLSLGISKHYLMFTLLRKDGNLDNVRILGNRQKALEWGSELFNYYLKDSTPINKI